MYKKIIEFWFEELSEEKWFAKDPDLDKRIFEEFGEVYWEVVAGEHADWRSEPLGRLAEILVLDQFSRNIFRGDAQAFAHDPMALALAQEAIRAGDDQKLEPRMRTFCYLPFMHSESLKVHLKALELFENLGNENSLRYEKLHKEIIDRFGRYPHRNEVLGRESTSEELEFLKTHDGF